MKYDHVFNAGERYRIKCDSPVHRNYWGASVEFVDKRGYNFYPSCHVRAECDGRDIWVSPAYLEACDEAVDCRERTV